MADKAENSAAPGHETGPVFIVGAPRSGTTLLQYMLRSHPHISLPTGESHFIIPLYRKKESFGDLHQRSNLRKVVEAMYLQSAEFLETDLHGMNFELEAFVDELYQQRCCTLPDIVRALFEKNAAGEGKLRWGDKTPYYVLHLPKILEWFPDARIIHLIRDGRDCALSMFARRYDFHVYNIYHAANYWKQYVDAGQEAGQHLDKEVYFELRYEDILADQELAMQRLCLFLGEEFSPSLIDFHKTDHIGKTPLLQEPVQEDNKEKWRTRLSAWQLRVFESVAADTLSRNGYPLTTSGARLPLSLRIIYRSHNAFLRRMRRMTGKHRKTGDN